MWLLVMQEIDSCLHGALSQPPLYTCQVFVDGNHACFESKIRGMMYSPTCLGGVGVYMRTYSEKAVTID